jgi:hypothetical protein
MGKAYIHGDPRRKPCGMQNAFAVADLIFHKRVFHRLDFLN